MVIYTYECKKCGHEQDKLFRDTEERKAPKCEKCKSETKRVLSGKFPPDVSWSQWRV